MPHHRTRAPKRIAGAHLRQPARLPSWYRDRDFWRDVWSGTVSALIVASILYLTASAFGIVQRRPALVLTAAVVVVNALTALVALSQSWFATAGERLAFREEPSIANLRILLRKLRKTEGVGFLVLLPVGLIVLVVWSVLRAF